MGKKGKIFARMIGMLIGVAILFGVVFAIKVIEKKAQKKFAEEHKIQIFTVSAMQAVESPWQPRLTATGSLRTVEGVNVTTELAGMVRDVDMVPGAVVKKGTLLVQLNIDPEVAKLHSLEAEAAYAKITYDRDKRQYAIGAVSAETLAGDEANYKSTAAQVDEEKAIIAKKTICAPFGGRLGISLVYPGQYINPGDAVAVLQTVDPIYVDFYMPQEVLHDLRVGQNVNVTVDSFKDKTFAGKITTINPEVDSNTRNFVAEGTLPNQENLLMPGMFVNVMVTVGSSRDAITLPQTAVTYNPYGDFGYILQKTSQTKDGKPVWKATQQFITTGETRGYQISILKGVSVGDWIVTSGQLKLQNDSLVIIDNSVQPSDNPDPTVTEPT